MKWKYRAGDFYTHKSYIIVISHTPDWNEVLRLQGHPIQVIVPWGKHKYGIHVISNFIRSLT